MTTGSPASIVPLEIATFTFAADEPEAGREGVVLAHAIRLPDGVVLFDTGFGFGSRLVDERYHPRTRRLPDLLEAAGIAIDEIRAVVNCHLHIDHAGQNSVFARVPIYLQRREWDVAHTTEHTILEWIDFDAADYRLLDGDHELLPGVRVVATPGHTPGHQSLVVQTSLGAVVLVGQAVYSAGEWLGDPSAREGRSRAWDRDAYDASVARLRAVSPVRVYFAHDRAEWSRGHSAV